MILVFCVVVAAFVFLFLALWTLKSIKKAKEDLPRYFKAESLEIMQTLQHSFFSLANQTLKTHQEGAKTDLQTHKQSVQDLVEPLQEAISKLEKEHRELEKKRESAYLLMEKQLENLVASEKALRSETFNLSKALRSPSVRGTWGQLHLRRVVELAGMQKYCDFTEEVSQESDGKKIRPDLVVHLPGKRQIIVDAKTPLYAYLEALEKEEEEGKIEKMKEHAAHIRKHVKELSSKEYWKQFSPTPECVILFLPSESFFSEAVRLDPDLIETGFLHNVIVATPTTLMSVLKAASLSWKQDSISQNAKEIAELGKQLYERLLVMSSHFSKLGKSVNHSVETYNQTVASLKTRVFPCVKKLQEKAHHTKETEPLIEVQERASLSEVYSEEP